MYFLLYLTVVLKKRSTFPASHHLADPKVHLDTFLAVFHSLSVSYILFSVFFKLPVFLFLDCSLMYLLQRFTDRVSAALLSLIFHV